jgi:hypothetical protein
MQLDSPEDLVKSLLLAVKPVNKENESQTSSEATIADYSSIKTLLNKALAVVNTKIQSLDKVSIPLEIKSEDSILKIADISFQEPRGKFNLSILKSGILLEGKQCSVMILWENISHIALVMSNSSLKKEGEDLLALKLVKAQRCMNRELINFLFTLSKNEAKKIDVMREYGSIQGHESYVVSKLVEELSQQTIQRSSHPLFHSMMTQKPYVRCYKGIQEGALYPLANGLLFLKPMIFIPAEEIASLSAGRGGSSSSTKYIDIVVSRQSPLAP